jgi:DNA (cytosine-5)-methyltransferase 3A
MKVLSLFDGMACGMIAMLNAGIEVESYDAYEIDKYAIKVSSHNFPNIKHHGDVFQADFTQYEGVDFLVGGSPCTYWSIAQKNNRETEASGMGWELFSQYVRAVKEAKPKFFIYENNKSMSAAIRESIDRAFGFEAVYINSALVSAQNRQRLYWVGMRNPDGSYSKVPVDQPQDRGLLLRDILESWVQEQAYEMEDVGIGYRGRTEDGKRVKRYECNCEPKSNALTTAQTDSTVAEPIRVGDIGSTAQAHRVYSCDGKSVTINAGGGGQGGKTGLYLTPITGFAPGESTSSSQMEFLGGIVGNREKWLDDGKNFSRNFSQGHRLYGTNGKAVAQTAQPCGHAGNTGAYVIPCEVETLSDEYYHGNDDSAVFGKIVCKNTSNNNGQPAQGTRVYKTDNKSICLDTDSRKYVIDAAPKTGWCIGNNGKKVPVYEVRDGLITIKDKQYPIKLADGYYIIRKLTVRECMRLQTVPEEYDFSVISNAQAYKCLGNGWTCDVITHLINATQKATRRKWLYDLLGDCL